MTSFEAYMHSLPKKKSPRVYQQRVKQADVARKLMADMRSVDVLSATSKVALENMINAPGRPPKNADEKAYLAKTVERNAGRIREYAAYVVRTKEKEIARIRKTYGL